MVIYELGSGMPTIYVGRKFTIALLSGDYWSDEVEIYGWCGRAINAVYLSWLRQHAPRYPESAILLGQLIKKHAPHLENASDEVPFWYRPPEPSTEVYWDDECKKRVQQASRQRKAGLEEKQKGRVYGVL
jgi:hypothetical protein